MTITPVSLPYRGLNLVAPATGMPPGFTTSAKNVRPFDPRTGRMSISKRHGLTRASNTSVSGPAVKVDWLAEPQANTFGELTVGASKASDDLTYANGAVDALADWEAFTSNANFINAGFSVSLGSDYTFTNTSDGAHPAISSNTMVCTSGTTAGTARLARYEPVVGTIPFVVEMDVLTANASSATSLCKFGVCVGLDGSNTASKQIVAVCKPASIASSSFGSGLFQFGIFQGSAERLDLRLVQADTMGIETNSSFKFRFWVTSSAVFITVNDTIVAYAGVNNLAIDGLNVGVFLNNVTSGQSVVGVDNFLLADASDAVQMASSSLYAASDGVVAKIADDGDVEAVSGGSYAGALVRHAEAPDDDGKRYLLLVDGESYYKIWLDGNIMDAWEATTGNLPGVSGSSSPSPATLICNYGSRIVLSGAAGEPENVYMSRVGNAFDWDFTQTDALAALTFDGSDVGLVPDIVTALMPFEEDLLIIGCRRSLWALKGDPGFGGVLVNITRDSGPVGGDAWARDYEGRLYYCSQEGVNVILPGGSKPELITKDRIDPFFRDLDFSLYSVRLSYSQRQHGLHVFITPRTRGASTHFFWDSRTASWWQDEFAVDHGPTAAAYSRSRGGVVVGGFDGVVRQFSQAATWDDGETIDAHCDLGLYGVGGDRRVQIARLLPECSAETGAIEFSGHRAGSAREAIDAVAAWTFSRSGPGRINPIATKMAANWLRLRVGSNNATDHFSLESLSADVMISGRKGSVR